MFLYLNGLVVLILLFYFSPWLFSATTTGVIIKPFEPNTLHAQFIVGDRLYTGRYMRSGIAFTERSVPIRYVRFQPQTSRINTFMGMWAEPIGWWAVFVLASSMLLLTDNTVFSKGTVFQLQKKYPWISMEEYFPYSDEWYYQKKHKNASKNDRGETPLLKSWNND
jgi:hypothetical protein